MSRIAFTGNALGTGTVTMAAPNTNSDRTVTLPDTTGTLYISGGDIGTPSSGDATNLINLNASNLATGTVPDARFPATLPAASGANLTALNASNLASGTVPDARFPATLPATSGANLTNLNASNLSTGTVGTARLGSGTANNTTFLRGDGTWATASSTPTTAQVLSATAGLTAGDVGSYGFVRPAANSTGGAINPGTTVAGSNIRWAGGTTGSALSGTWRWLGTAATFDPDSGNWTAAATVAVRIS